MAGYPMPNILAEIAQLDHLDFAEGFIRLNALRLRTLG